MNKIKDELNDMPIVENTTENVKNSEFIALHDAITNLIHDFITKHDINDAWSISYDIDDLQSLNKHGVTCPSCDTSLTVFNEYGEAILCSM